MKNQKYDWKEFYQAFAKRLLDFKDDRSDLIDKVKRIYSSTGIKLPTLEKDNQMVDIDPFTVFGLFNKSQMREENRIKIITAIGAVARKLCYLLFAVLSENRPYEVRR